MRLIALEEHYVDANILATYDEVDRALLAPSRVPGLDELGDMRIRGMDEAGIDVQVLSHAKPGVQEMADAAQATALAAAANDALAWATITPLFKTTPHLPPFPHGKLTIAWNSGPNKTHVGTPGPDYQVRYSGTGMSTETQAAICWATSQFTGPGDWSMRMTCAKSKPPLPNGIPGIPGIPGTDGTDGSLGVSPLSGRSGSSGSPV